MLPPDRSLNESWTWRSGPFSVALRWDEDGRRLGASIAALGRDGELPANEEEAAWMDAAAAKAGAVRAWSPEWTVPPDRVGDLFEALGVDSVTRSFRPPTSAAQSVLGLLDADWSVTAYWDLPGGRVQIAMDSSGYVLIDGGDRFAAELSELLGEPLDNGRKRLDAGMTLERARAFLAWKREHLTWVMAFTTRTAA